MPERTPSSNPNLRNDSGNTEQVITERVITKKVIMVGCVNVGKSTLFNSLVGAPEALISSVAGATKDIRWGDVGGETTLLKRKSTRRKKQVSSKKIARKKPSSASEKKFSLADTAGLNAGGQNDTVYRLLWKSLEEADYVWLVIDAKATVHGLTADEQQLAQQLRRRGNRFCVVLSKAEGKVRELAEAESIRLGVEVLCVSAIQGIGLNELIAHTKTCLEINHTQNKACLPPEATITELADKSADKPQTESADKPQTELADKSTNKLADKLADKPTDKSADKSADKYANKYDAKSPQETSDDPDPNPNAAKLLGGVNLMVLGQPNVGKSSLVNMLLGEERMVVSDQAGETHEAISLKLPSETLRKALGSPAQWQVADSVGMRRMARISGEIERLGVAHSLRMLRRADVLVLVLDAFIPPGRQDARLASMAERSGCGLVLAMNKWDLLSVAEKQSSERKIAEKLAFVSFAPRVATSTVIGSGGGRLLRMVKRVNGERNREIRSSDLNRVLGVMVANRHPPAVAGHPTKLLYATQTGTKPPRFRLFTNHPLQIPDSYSRYLEGQMRHHFGFLGTPIRLDWQLK